MHLPWCISSRRRQTQVYSLYPAQLTRTEKEESSQQTSGIDLSLSTWVWESSPFGQRGWSGHRWSSIEASFKSCLQVKRWPEWGSQDQALFLLQASILVHDPTTLHTLLKKKKKSFILLSWAIYITFVIFKRKTLGTDFTDDILKRLWIFFCFVFIIYFFLC